MAFRIPWLLISFCWPLWAVAQSVESVVVSAAAEQYDATALAWVWTDSSQYADLDVARRAFARAEFGPVPQMAIRRNPCNGRYPRWVCFRVRHEGADTLRLVLRMGPSNFDTLQVWVQPTDATAPTDYQLRGTAVRYGAGEMFPLVPSRALVAFGPRSESIVWVRMQYFYGFSGVFQPKLYSIRSEMADTYPARICYIAIVFFVFAGFVVSAVVMLVWFWRFRRREYVYFLLTILCGMLHEWIYVERNEVVLRFLPFQLPHNYGWRIPVQMSGYIFCVLFARRFLQTSSQNPPLHGMFSGLLYFMVGYLVVSPLIAVCWDLHVLYQVTYYFRLIMFMLVPLMLLWLLHQYSRLTYFFIMGIGGLSLFNFLGFALSQVGLRFSSVFGIAEFLGKIGTVSLLCALWAGLIEKEKMERAALAQELQERRSLLKKWLQRLKTKDTEQPAEDPDQVFLRMLNTVLTQKAFDSAYSVQQMSQDMGMSYNSLHRKLLALNGQTVTNLLTETRLQRAQQLLLNPALSIGEVARSSGFEDPTYFSRVFKKHFDRTPTVWREENAAVSG